MDIVWFALLLFGSFGLISFVLIKRSHDSRERSSQSSDIEEARAVLADQHAEHHRSGLSPLGKIR